MNRLDFKERMRKVKWATKHRGECWGKKTIGVAAQMVMAIQGQDRPGNALNLVNFKAKTEPQSIKDLITHFNAKEN